MLERITKPSKEMHYGTSGYRDTFGLDLKNAIRRTTMAAIVRMVETDKSIGIMITASHNPVNDNGIKLIDHNGESIPSEYEEICDEFVNCMNLEETFDKILLKICKLKNKKEINKKIGKNSKILLGRDTRPSSPELAHSVIDLLNFLEISYFYHHIVSTQELHFLTKETNKLGKVVLHFEYIDFLLKNFQLINKNKSKIHFKSANEIVEDKTFCCTQCINEDNHPFKNDNPKEVGTIPSISKQSVNIETENINKLHPIDTAYGVGHKILNDLKLNIQILTGELLNYECGSDYILNNRNPLYYKENTWQAAFDGDSDRIIYFKKKDSLNVLDGDKLCIKLALLLKEIFNTHNLGCVLSIYSNSKAINFLSQFMPVEITETGVKNFIKKVKKFDIGLFFEPNGHGALHFKEEIFNQSNDFQKAILNLLSIGDAISNYLVIESLINLEKKEYSPNPIRDLALKVKDKSIKVNLEGILEKYKCLGFVRPSGTEDVIRIHLEGENDNELDKCLKECCEEVFNICGKISE